MKLASILFQNAFFFAGVIAQQNLTAPAGNRISALNDTESSSHGKSLVPRDDRVTWSELDDDQEVCANAEAKMVGEKMIIKRDCQKIVHRMSRRSGRWTVAGVGGGDVYAPLAYKGTCSFEVARVDDQNSDFEWVSRDRTLCFRTPRHPHLC